MGMFDYVQVFAPLPYQDAGDDGGNFQTKDMDCTLSTYVITSDGQLTLGGQRVLLTGVLHFYDGVRYNATFINGYLQSIAFDRHGRLPLANDTVYFTIDPCPCCGAPRGTTYVGPRDDAS